VDYGFTCIFKIDTAPSAQPSQPNPPGRPKNSLYLMPVS
jgi:hypothetical protein